MRETERERGRERGGGEKEVRDREREGEEKQLRSWERERECDAASINNRLHPMSF